MTKLATSSFVLCLFFFFGCGDTPAVNDADRASTFQSGYDEGYSMGITWPRDASVWWVGPHVTEDRHRDRPIPSLYRKAKDFSAGNKEENAELAEAFNWGVFCGFNDGVENENAAVSITGVFDAEIYRECYSDGSSLVTSQAEERVSSALITINPIIREYDSASDRAMDLLVDLKQLRATNTSWTENHRRNITSGGLSRLASAPDPVEYIWKIRGEPWQKDQRDDLRVEADQIKSILGQLQISRTRLSNASANVPELQRFRQTGLLAIDRQLRIIDNINGWYLEFMTRDAGESFTRELITMLDDAPALFLDARLRWASAKSDLPR